MALRSAVERIFLLVSLAPIFLACLITGCGEKHSQDETHGQVFGVSDNEIVIGSSLALTGHASFLGIQTLHGALAYFNHLNEQGGLNARRLRVVALDDAYDPARCVANTQKLINEEKVFALTCYVGTPTAIKIIPLVNEAKIPLVGLFTGASALRQPFQPYIINIRASYHEETGRAIRHFVEDLGIKKLGVLYQYDEFGFDGLTGAELALKEYGLMPVAKASFLRGTLDVDGAAEKISSSDAEAVIMIGTYAPCAEFVKLMKERKPGLLYHALSFVGAEELIERLGSDAEGVIVTQVVPPPWETAILPTAQEYHQLLARYFPDDQPSFVGFEGFINAMVLAEGLNRAGRDLTREKLINSIEGIQQFSLGIANPLNYSSSNHQGLQRVYFTQVRDGRLALVTNWEQIKKERAVAGVTPDEIILGSSCALTGHASFLGVQTIHGVLAYLNYINEKGGVLGRRVKLISYDDAYDPALCEANTLRLIDEDKVFALTSYVGTPTAVKAIPILEKAEIPLIGLFTGASIFRQPFQRYIINIRASYRQEIQKVVDHLVNDRKFSKFAVFYQNDEYGWDGLEGAKQSLSPYGLKPVATGAYERGSMEVEAAFETIARADPEAIIMVGTYDPCAKFIQLAKKRKGCLVFHNVSFVGPEELVKRLGNQAEGVLITQVVPPPWETTLIPAAEEYKTLLGRYFPGDQPNFVGFEGFVNAKVLVQALRRTGRDLTRERLIEAFEQMDFYSPGIGANINFGKDNHQGLDQVYPTLVKDGKLVLVNDWSQFKPCQAHIAK
jgi:ABC-type branched-subunit amino acid transport system substrate-binding protein